MINPIALLLFCICGITGYLLGDINGMLYGFLIPMLMSLAVELYEVFK